MSYYGFQILYHLLNRESDVIADRAYAPWVDFGEKLRKNSLALYGLESKVPLKSFDVLGFTLPYEMTFTNVLNILDLAQIPVRSSLRSDSDPIVIAGGSGAYNPEPLAGFIDLFVLGDGEELTVPLLRFLAGRRRKGIARDEILRMAVWTFSGLYYPHAYRREKTPGDNVGTPVPDDPAIPKRITAQRIPALHSEYFPVKPLIPVVAIAQDRLVTEIMRGCTQGCRFCQAGMIYRPVRERNPRALQQQIEASLQQTGYDSVSLLSLSSSDYGQIENLVAGLAELLESECISLSLPSLRLDSFSRSLAAVARITRKSGLTFAPEAGSEYLRRVINKSVTEEDLVQSVKLAIQYGWRLVKLYFMLGLPLEGDCDIDEIIRLTRLVYEQGNRRLSINITLSTFIPKPFTPFQWEAQDPPEEIQRKIDRIKQGLAPFKRIKIMVRDPFYSLLEGAISRGDSRMAQVIYCAWKKGAKFDSWRELFNPSVWVEAFREQGLAPTDFTRRRSVDEPLPWDIIDARVTKQFLADECAKAYRAETSPDCRNGCIDCGVCDFKSLLMKFAPDDTVPLVRNPVRQDDLEQKQTNLRYRINYYKQGPARFIAHLDTLRLFRQAFRRVGWKLAFTEGFNRRPKMAAGFPLPLGYASNDEYLDVTAPAGVNISMKEIDRSLPEGIGVKSLDVISKGRSIFAATTGFVYELRFFKALPEMIHSSVQQLLESEEIVIERPRQRDIRRVNVRPFVETITHVNMQQLQISTRVIDGRTVRPEELLPELSIFQRPVICRLKTYLEN